MSDGRTLVLIHAFALGTRMWSPQLSAFPGWRVVTPALPGYDGTAASEASMEAYATQVTRELDRLHIDDAVIGGLSLGGYVTFGIMRQQPERVRALILVDTRSGVDSDEVRAMRLRLLQALETSGTAGVFEEMRPTLFGATTDAERPGVVDQVRRMVESQTPAAIEGAIRAMLGRPDSMPLLRTVTVPTLIVVGEEDVMSPPADSEAMQAAIRGASLVRIPRAGHISNLEAPEAFNQAVRAFLATVAKT